MQLKGSTFIVTGGASGLGEGTVKMLVEARRAITEGRSEAAISLVQRAEEWLAIPTLPPPEESGERPAVGRAKTPT